jgi:hypothetical protein
MFSELPKLFERNFAMAFFMPIALFVALSLLILDQFQIRTIVPALQMDILLGTTLFGLLSWLGGILLLVTNRDLYRLLEGYGKYNPAKLFGWIEKRRYRKLVETRDKLDDEYRAAGDNFPVEKRSERNRIMRELAERFPDNERWLLPTAFGNTLRAFEVYPRKMYGLESIDGWSRILAVVPADYRSLIDNAKAQVDFWVNLGFLGFLLLVEYFAAAYYIKAIHAWWLLGIIAMIILVAPYRARRVAIEWGDMVKAAFDIHRFKLIESLGIDIPKNREAEKNMWKRYSRAIIYGLPDELPELKVDDQKEPKPSA